MGCRRRKVRGGARGEEGEGGRGEGVGDEGVTMAAAGDLIRAISARWRRGILRDTRLLFDGETLHRLRHVDQEKNARPLRIKY